MIETSPKMCNCYRIVTNCETELKYCDLFMKPYASTSAKLQFMSTLTSTASTLTSTASTLTSTPNSFIKLHGRHIDKNGDYGIHIQSRHGNTEVVRCMIEMGVDVTLIGENEQTALYQASRFGHTEVVKLLLGVLKCTDNGILSKSLYIASGNGHLSTVKLLLEFMVEPKNGFIEEAFNSASYNGSTEIAKLLLEAGAFDHYSTTKENIMKQYFTETETVVDDTITVYKRPLYIKVRCNGDPYIITLKLPVNAESNIGYFYGVQANSSVKYRASCMYVERIEYANAKSGTVDSIHNDSPKGSLTYTVGSMVYPDKYTMEAYEICSSGIHFYMSRESAEQYICW